MTACASGIIRGILCSRSFPRKSALAASESATLGISRAKSARIYKLSCSIIDELLLNRAGDTRSRAALAPSVRGLQSASEWVWGSF